jgi:lysozyme family protein
LLPAEVEWHLEYFIHRRWRCLVFHCREGVRQIFRTKKTHLERNKRKKKHVKNVKYFRLMYYEMVSTTTFPAFSFAKPLLIYLR